MTRRQKQAARTYELLNLHAEQMAGLTQAVRELQADAKQTAVNIRRLEFRMSKLEQRVDLLEMPEEERGNW